jgi:hypothetical protein
LRVHVLAPELTRKVITAAGTQAERQQRNRMR